MNILVVGGGIIGAASPPAPAPRLRVVLCEREAIASSASSLGSRSWHRTSSRLTPGARRDERGGTSRAAPLHGPRLLPRPIGARRTSTPHRPRAAAAACRRPVPAGRDQDKLRRQAPAPRRRRRPRRAHGRGRRADDRDRSRGFVLAGLPGSAPPVPVGAGSDLLVTEPAPSPRASRSRRPRVVAQDEAGRLFAACRRGPSFSPPSPAFRHSSGARWSRP
jgi:hypothetical protein